MDQIDITKGTGPMTGAAWVAWDGNYSFDANGAKIPVESARPAAFPRRSSRGSSGSTRPAPGTFDDPRYDVTATIADLFVATKGSARCQGTCALRGTC
jgi:hypothetical protein